MSYKPIGHRVADWLFKRVERLLSWLGGVYSYEDTGSTFQGKRLFFHWQNLNESKIGAPKGFPWAGRWFLHIHDKHGGTVAELHQEWELGSFSFCLALSFGRGDSEQETKVSFCIPGLSLFFGVEGWPKWFWSRWERRSDPNEIYEDREISIRIFDNALWWTFWKSSMTWKSSDSKWKNGNWHPLDTFFGKKVHSKEVLSEHDVLIPMPEGPYPATVVLERRTWRRPRWPWWPALVVLEGADISIPVGIPFEGKGENSWDCGEDGLWDLGSGSKTVAGAIADTVRAVLEHRSRYDRDIMAKYPDPAIRIAAYAARGKDSSNSKDSDASFV